MKIQPNGVQQEQPQSSVRKGGWREKLLYSRREIEDSSFLAAEEELTSKNPIIHQLVSDLLISRPTDKSYIFLFWLGKPTDITFIIPWWLI